MKSLCRIAFAIAVLSFTISVLAQNGGAQPSPAAGHTNAVAAEKPDTSVPAKPGGCSGCSQKATPASKTVPIPGHNESMVVGRIENLVPISVVAVLGCEKCVEETVAWALQQGSSYDDVDRVLRTLAEMQKLSCFNEKFGPDTAARLEEPLAAGRRVLQQAVAQAAK